ncbi:hypothetical protein [Streptomyces aquilus]
MDGKLDDIPEARPTPREKGLTYAVEVAARPEERRKVGCTSRPALGAA